MDEFGASHDLAVTRFDYSGHGQSGGDFNDGTISRWLEEAEAVFETTRGPQVVIGSSMGGWLALLLTRALRRRGSERVQGLVLIAPATDMDRADAGADAEEISQAARQAGLRRHAQRVCGRALSHQPGADRGQQAASAVRARH